MNLTSVWVNLLRLCLFTQKTVEKLSESSNKFECSGGAHISMLYVCDDVKDCPGEAMDEIGCECNETESYSHRCKYLIHPSGRKVCSAFYVSTGSEDCTLYSFSKGNVRDDNDKGETTARDVHPAAGQTVPNNSVSAWTPQVASKIHPISSSCQEKGQLPCRHGNAKCYDGSVTCKFKLNTFGHTTPCRTGDHIQNCTNFPCNMMFKCPGYYCIPWSYVCNGNWDCPSGFDEPFLLGCRKHRTCNHSFKCRNYNLCVHLGDLCNGYRDCPLGDDEYLCSLQRKHCPSLCECLLFVLRCYKIRFSLEENLLLHIVWIHFANFSKQLPEQTFKGVLVLTITRTNLDQLCHLTANMSDILKLDTSSNFIVALKPGCFQSSTNLKVLNVVAINKISSVGDSLFANLSNLLIFNLSRNPIFLHNSIFRYLAKIISLSLLDNNLTLVERDTFEGFQVFYLQTENYHLCCVKPSKAICSAKLPWHVSCSNLLPNPAVQVLF